MSVSKCLVVLGTDLVSSPLHVLLAQLILIQVGRCPIEIQKQGGERTCEVVVEGKLLATMNVRY